MKFLKIKDHFFALNSIVEMVAYGSKFSQKWTADISLRLKGVEQVQMLTLDGTFPSQEEATKAAQDHIFNSIVIL